MANESEQYASVCKGEFAEINTKLDRLHNRLYVDNGAESVQSKLNRHERYIRAMAWLTGIAATASVSTLVTMAVRAIWQAVEG